MPRPARTSGAVLAVVALLAAVAATGQEKQVYRYTDADGRVVYSDRPPPDQAKGVQTKRVDGNFIETSEPSIALRQASERFPVTLYSFACGDPCQSAEALLNARGVPFARVNVEDQQGMQKLKELTGELNVPVLQVGDKLIAKGFNDARWQTMLDDAGYPRAPTRRTTRPAGPPAAPPEVRAEGSGDGPAPGTRATELAAPRGGYPK